MSRCALQLGIFCLLVLGLAARNPLAARTPEEKEGERLVQQSPNDAKTKAKKAGDKKTPSAVQLSQSPALTAAEIHRSLRKPVEVEFKDTPLSDAAAFIAQSTDTNIVLDEQALTEEGVSVDEPINLLGKPIAGARLLDRILPPLGLTWIVHDDVVQVTTMVAAEEILVTRTYPVGDILRYAKKHRSKDTSAENSLSLQTVQFGGIGGGCGGCCFEAVLSPPSLPESWLINTLEVFTSGPWVNIDGTGGSISYANNNLVVRQTYKVQTEIDQTLKTLRQFTKGESKTKAVEIHPPYYATAEDEAVKQALTKVVSVKCDRMPLDKFLGDVTGKLDVPLYIDKQALTEEGVAIDEPVTLDLKDMPAKSLLKVMLKRLGLTVLVDDGQLYVTTIIAAEERLVATLYDVRDLEQSNYTMPVLVNLLQNETSGPWVNVDGTGGGIEAPLQGLLVVRQTQKVREQIADILADLRKQIAEGPAAAQPAPPDPKKVSTKMYRMDFISNPDSAGKPSSR